MNYFLNIKKTCAHLNNGKPKTNLKTQLKPIWLHCTGVNLQEKNFLEQEYLQIRKIWVPCMSRKLCCVIIENLVTEYENFERLPRQDDSIFFKNSFGSLLDKAC